YPSFIDDYIAKHQLKAGYLNTSYGSKPTVGFCGQANHSKKHAIEDMFKQQTRNFKSYLGFSFSEPQQILSTSYLRASLLKTLESKPEVEANFIIRKQYRAGVKQDKKSHATTKEFYNNILESQYVLCVRGAGNFS